MMYNFAFRKNFINQFLKFFAPLIVADFFFGILSISKENAIYIILINLNIIYPLIALLIFAKYWKKYKRHLENIKELRFLINEERRKCVMCKGPIEIKNFYMANKKLGIEKINNLWNNSLFEFACCLCMMKLPKKFWNDISDIR